MTEAKPGIDVMAHFLCGNHCNNLVEVSLTAIVGSDVISKLWACPMLLKQGSYFLRLVGSLRRWLSIDGNLLIIYGPPPVAATEFAREFSEYFIRQHDQYASAIANSGLGLGRGARVKQKIKAAWGRFLAQWNGPYWIRGRVVHYEPRGSTRERKDIVADMTNAYASVVFRTLPVGPEAGKWTKLGPSVDWHVKSDVVHGIVGHLMTLAFQQLTDSYLQHPAETVDPRAEGRELEATQWHKMAGVRMQRVLELYEDTSTRVKLAILLIIIETTRHLTCFWLRASREVADTREPPGLLDFANPQLSQHVAALQYLRLVGAGASPRLRLIYVPSGFDSFTSWSRAFPDMADLLRRLAQSASCWVYRRHVAKVHSWPWKFAVLADQRVDYLLRRDIAREAHARPRCCVGRLAKTLAARSGTPAALASPEWGNKLVAIARSAQRVLSMADVERGHHVTKTLVTGVRSSSDAVCAGHVLKQAKQLQLSTQHRRRMQALQCICQERFSADAPQPLSDELGLRRRTTRKSTGARAQGALWHFRKRAKILDPAVSEMLGTGVRANQFTREYHEAIRHMWQVAPIHVREASQRDALLHSLRVVASRGVAGRDAQRLHLPHPSSASASSSSAASSGHSAITLVATSPGAGIDAYGDAIASAPEPGSVMHLATLLRATCEACSAAPAPGARLDTLPLTDRLAYPANLHSVVAPGGAGELLAEASAPVAEIDSMVVGMHPLHESHYSKIRREASKTSLRHAFQHWSRTIIMSNGSVPSKVSYENLCGKLCLSTMPPSLLAFRNELLVELKSLASNAGVPIQRVCYKDIFISVEVRTQVEGSPASLSQVFYALLCASGAIGNAKPTQTFIAYRRVGGLSVPSEARVPLKHMHPLGSSRCLIT